jgi:hypothetical protein
MIGGWLIKYALRLQVVYDWQLRDFNSCVL